MGTHADFREQPSPWRRILKEEAHSPMIKSALAVALGLAAYALAQTADSPRGHWTGALQLPNQTLEMVFDLDKTAKGWVGSRPCRPRTPPGCR